MRQYEMFELTFQGKEPEGSYVKVDLQARFRCEENSWTVKGFYAGSGTYKVRFLPRQTGVYEWEVTGMIQASGQEACVPADNKHHGMVRTEGMHFVYEDGTTYLPFGTTVYALAHQPERLIAQTMDTLKESPFNKVRHCIFPKHYLYNRNEPQFFPFKKDGQGNWDVNRPCMKFWEHFEAVVEQLGGMGIETDLILFHSYDRWGFSLLTMDEWKIYLDYAIRRLAAYPCIWWSLANEYDLLFNRTIEDWYEIEEYVAEEDPYGHLLSNHNCVHFYDFARGNITHCSVQSSGMYKAAVWRERYKKPLIYDECCYEGNIFMPWGNISAFEMVNRFWCGVSLGAYVTHGETYLSGDEVLWWAKGGVLKGESVPRIGFLKEILYSLPGHLEPWQEPVDVDLTEINLTAGTLADPNEGFKRLYLSATDEDREISAAKETTYYGHCKDEVFLKYFARQCVAQTTIELPKDRNYRIEMIDVWEMTTTVIAENASGTTALNLPGKEGIAVLATAK